MHAEARDPFWSSFSAALCALLLCSIVNIGHSQDLSTADPEFWEKYTDLADWATVRLKLTPEQEKSVIPILEKSFEKRLKILEEYGFTDEEIPQLTEKQREEIDAKFIGVRADTRAKLVKLLNAEQLEELKKIQTEAHMEFRQRLPKAH